MGIPLTIVNSLKEWAQFSLIKTNLSNEENKTCFINLLKESKTREESTENLTMELIKIEKKPPLDKINFVPCFDALERAIKNSNKKQFFIVSICGPQGSGKSTLCNFFAESEIFKAGHLGEHTTQGVWFTLLDYPKDKDTAILLLDCEGSGSNIELDNRLIVAITLVSHMIIYNFSTTLDATKRHLLTLFNLVKTITSRIPAFNLRTKLIIQKFLLLQRNVLKSHKSLKHQMDSLILSNEEYKYLKDMDTFQLPPIADRNDQFSQDYEILKAFASEDFKQATQELWENILEKLSNPQAFDKLEFLIKLACEGVIKEKLDRFIQPDIYDALIYPTENELQEFIDTFLKKIIPISRTRLAMLWNRKKKTLCSENDPKELKEKLNSLFARKYEEIEKENQRQIIFQKWEIVEKEIKSVAETSFIETEDVRKIFEELKEEISLEFNQLHFNLDENLIRETIGDDIENLMKWLKERPPKANQISFEELFGKIIKGWFNSIFKPRLIQAYLMKDINENWKEHLGQHIGKSFLYRVPFLIPLLFPMSIPTAFGIQILGTMALNKILSDQSAVSSGTQAVTSSAISQVMKFVSTKIPYLNSAVLTANVIYKIYCTRKQCLRMKEEKEIFRNEFINALTKEIPFNNEWKRTLNHLKAQLLLTEPIEWISVFENIPKGTRLLKDLEQNIWKIFPIHSINNESYEWKLSEGEFSVQIHSSLSYDLKIISIDNISMHSLLIKLVLSSSNSLIPKLGGLVHADKNETPSHSEELQISSDKSFCFYTLQEYSQIKSFLNLHEFINELNGDNPINVQDYFSNALAQIVLGLADLQTKYHLNIRNLSVENLEIIENFNMNEVDKIEYNLQNSNSTIKVSLPNLGFLVKLKSFEYSSLEFTIKNQNYRISSNMNFLSFLKGQTKIRSELIQNALQRISLEFSETWDLHIFFRRLSRETKHDLWRHPLVSTFWAYESYHSAISTGLPYQYEPILSDALESSLPKFIRDITQTDVALSVPINGEILTPIQFSQYLLENDWELLMDGPSWPLKLTPSIPIISLEKENKFIVVNEDIFNQRFKNNWKNYLNHISHLEEYPLNLFPEISSDLIQQFLTINENDSVYIGAGVNGKIIRCQMNDEKLIFLKIINLDNEDEPVLILNPPEAKGSIFFNEVVCGMVLNELYEKGICPNFTQIYGSAIQSKSETQNISTFLNLFRSSQKSLRKANYGCLAMEYINGGTLLNFDKIIAKLQYECHKQKKRIPLRDEYIHNAIFQVVGALSISQQYFCFVHKNLHPGNIMIQLCQEQIFNGKKLSEYEYFEYKIKFKDNEEQFSIPNLGFIIKIIDFGLSQVTLDKLNRFPLINYFHKQNTITFFSNPSPIFWDSIVTNFQNLTENSRLVSEPNHFLEAIRTRGTLFFRPTFDLQVFMNNITTQKLTARNSATISFEKQEQEAHLKEYGNLDRCEIIEIDKLLLDIYPLRMPKDMDNAITRPEDFLCSQEFVQYRNDMKEKPKTYIRSIKRVLTNINLAEIKLYAINKSKIENLEPEQVIDLVNDISIGKNLVSFDDLKYEIPISISQRIEKLKKNFNDKHIELSETYEEVLSSILNDLNNESTTEDGNDSLVNNHSSFSNEGEILMNKAEIISDPNSSLQHELSTNLMEIEEPKSNLNNLKEGTKRKRLNNEDSPESENESEDSKRRKGCEGEG